MQIVVFSTDVPTGTNTCENQRNRKLKKKQTRNDSLKKRANTIIDDDE